MCRLLILLLLAGCQSTQFHYMSKKHTFTYTAEVLAKIQGDYCKLTPEDKQRVQVRLDRFIEDGWLAFGCGYDPRIPDL